MSSIFATPEEKSGYDYKILFFHGLEGSTNGTKAAYLKKRWKAFVPPLRTADLTSLKSDNGHAPWEKIDSELINQAIAPTVKDAIDAVNYVKPDMIIGSSMGGGILMKLILDGIVSENTPCIFLAPAIKQLLGLTRIPILSCSSWILAECDEVVPNNYNIKACVESGGNLMICPEETHRLSSIVENGVLDIAIISCIEISSL